MKRHVIRLKLSALRSAPRLAMHLALLSVAWWLAASSAIADPFAPCAVASGPTTNSPSKVVAVTILSVTVGGDEDTDVLFFTDRADLYGSVTIGTNRFSLPIRDGSDSPHWDDTNGRFTAPVEGDRVTIIIDVYDDDGSVSGGNDQIDLNPAPAKRQLEFEFGLCSMRLSGDISSPAQGVLESAGSGAHPGRIRFKVEMADGRPGTAHDLALVEADLIQVVPQTGRLVAGKPTVVMVRVVNNTTDEVSTAVALDIFGEGITAIHEVLPIDPPLGPGEVRRQYFHVGTPLIFPELGSPPASYEITLNAQVDPVGIWRFNLPPGDCRRDNDVIADDPKKGLIWKVVPARSPRLLWCKTGTLLDAASLVPDSQFDEIRGLGSAFIKGVYPVPDLITRHSTVPVIPPGTAAFDFIATLLSALDIPLDAADPLLMVAELNGMSALISVVEPHDLIMGVLPSSGWFDRFSFGLWSGITGFSLGELAQHAVIFLPRQAGGGTEPPGPAITLPAHEFGHTLDLSVDSRLKDSIFCGLDDPILGPAICGISGGLDEYTSDDPALKSGNPARGFWVKQGGEPAALLPLVNQEQCDSRCLMGPSTLNDHLNWESRKHWIDSADYEHALDRLALVPDPAVIFVSGMIDLNDRVFLWPWYRVPDGTPDRPVGAPGLYRLAFLDGLGNEIQHVGLPVSWKLSDAPFELPMTTFALYLPDAPGTRRIQIWNVANTNLLAERVISSNAPTVQIIQPTSGLSVPVGSALSIEWTGHDPDGDALEYSVLVSTNGQNWSIAAYRLTKQNWSFPTDPLTAGTYTLKVLAADGVNVGQSQPVSFVVQPPPAFVTMQVPSGYSTIANNYNQGGNTLSEVMPQVMDGTIVFKWNFITQKYESSAYAISQNGWPPNTTLAPGEGAFIYSPSPQTITFSGQVPPAPPGEVRPPTSGKRFRSARWPAPSSFESVNGFAPAGGDQVLLYEGAFNSFPPAPTSTHIHSNGVWNPPLPLWMPGKAAFVDLVALPVISCATNKIVECGTAWTFDPPTYSGGCCANLTVAELGTVTNRGPCQSTYKRAWRATDCCSNSITCYQTVTVVDSTMPMIQCPTNLVFNCTGINGRVVDFTVSATDTCDPKPAVICTPAPGSYFPVGKTLVTCVARDACGNSNSCSFPVTVLNDCPPAPVLTATQLSSCTIEFCWPDAVTNSALQCATNLAPPIGWQDVNLPTLVTNGARCVIMTNTCEAMKFFRLRLGP